MMDLSKYDKNSKVWVFQSDESFDQVATSIESEMNSFLSSWHSHGKKVEAMCELVEGRFIVVASNEAFSSVSGCGIDELVHFVSQLGKTFQRDFFDRKRLYFLQGNELKSCSFFMVREEFEKGAITEESVIFDISVNTVESYTNRWKIPMKRSWVYGRLIQGSVPG